jgi:hypothetical protein
MRTPLLRRLAWGLFIGLQSMTSFAADYYVSPSGNDANAGTSASAAWQTIVQLNTQTFAPGDRILFERGGVYRGNVRILQSGNVTNPITITAFGSGADPVISGSIEITGWSLHQGSVYKATVPERIGSLYVSGARMTRARFPNTGNLRMGAVVNRGIFSDSTLTQANGYWNGADIFMRLSNTVFDRKPIANYANQGFTLVDSFSNQPYAGFGYILENKLSLLDMAGEYFHDTLSNTLYLWPLNGGSPSGQLVEGTALDYGITVEWKRNYIQIEGISFMHQQERGLFLNNSRGTLVDGCTFSHLDNVGLYSSGPGCEIRNCTVTDIDRRGIFVGGDSCFIHHNQVTRVSDVFGYQEDWGNVGFYINGHACRLEHNNISHCGYMGAILTGNRTEFRNNEVHEIGTQSNYGISVLLATADSTLLVGNILHDGAFNAATQPETQAPFNYGILNGDPTTLTTIRDNTIAHFDYVGIYTEHMENGVLQGNVLFDNGRQLYMDDQGASAFVTDFNSQVEDNVFFSLYRDQYAYELRTRQASAAPSRFADFANNYVYNPYGPMLVSEVRNDGSNNVRKRYGLARWQDEWSQDMTSQECFVQLQEYIGTDTMGSNLLYNSDFTWTITDWYAWSLLDLNYAQNIPGMSGGAMRVAYTGSSTNEAAINHYGIVPSKNQLFDLRFRVRSNQHGELRTHLLRDGEPWNTLGFDTRVPLTTSTAEWHFTFKAKEDADEAILRFMNRLPDSLYWLDDVYLYAIDGYYSAPEDNCILLMNPTEAATTENLGGVSYQDINGQPVSGAVTLAPYSSMVLIRTSPAPVSAAAPTYVRPSLRLYPNPIAGDDSQLYVRLTGQRLPKDATAAVYDLTGRTLGEGLSPVVLGNDTYRIQLPQLSPGIYLVRLGDAPAARLIVR